MPQTQKMDKQTFRRKALARADAWMATASRMHSPQCICVCLQYAQLWYHDAGMPQHARACEAEFNVLIERS